MAVENTCWQRVVNTCRRLGGRCTGCATLADEDGCSKPMLTAGARAVPDEADATIGAGRGARQEQSAEDSCSQCLLTTLADEDGCSQHLLATRTPADNV